MPLWGEKTLWIILQERGNGNSIVTRITVKAGTVWGQTKTLQIMINCFTATCLQQKQAVSRLMRYIDSISKQMIMKHLSGTFRGFLSAVCCREGFSQKLQTAPTSLVNIPVATLNKWHECSRLPDTSKNHKNTFCLVSGVRQISKDTLLCFRCRAGEIWAF